MKVEFNPDKRAETLAERGLDFLDAPLVFAGETITAKAGERSDGEERWITYGSLDGRNVVVVWTWRGEARRIISMRHAHDEEMRNARMDRPR